MLAAEEEVALREMASAELARRRLLDFCERIDPSYERPRHIALIAARLEALERGEIRRLIICTPPRHGKSRLCSQLFPAWILGRHPSQSIVAASYGQELAEQNARRVRDAVLSDRYPFDTRIRQDSRSAGRWETEQGGTAIAAGVGSSLTGFGADVLIADDPVRSREDAESIATRESTWGWWTDVARTRLHPGGRIVVIGTRWHEDDLIGRILSSPGAHEWEQLILPAICDEPNDPLGRSIGEPLWRERFPISELPSVERGELSTRSWEALYQQRPGPASGVIFKREWFAERYDSVPDDRPRRHPVFGILEHRQPNIIVSALDTALKDGPSNDFSALVTLCYCPESRRYYVLDVDRGHYNFPDLARHVLDGYRRHLPRLIYIESTAQGSDLILELRRQTSVPVLGVAPRGTKIARAEAVTGLCEAGLVFLPKTAEWLGPFIEEIVSFPVAKHDDQVDAFTLALAKLREAQAQQSTITTLGQLNTGMTSLFEILNNR